MNLRKRHVAAVIALAIAAGCSASHTAGSAVLPATGPAAAQHVSAAPSKVEKGTAEFVITIDRTAKDLLTHAPSYVSGKTQSMKIVQSYQTKKSYVVPLTSKSQGCTQKGSVLTCVVKKSVETGYQSFQVTLYASTNAKGVPLSEGQANGDVTQNRTTKFRMVLDAVVASMSASVPAITIAGDGQRHTSSFTVGALDATGAAIVGGGTLSTNIQTTLSGDPGAPYGSLVIAPSNIQKLPKTGIIPVKVTYGGGGGTITSASINFVMNAANDKTVTLLSVPFATLQASPTTLPGVVMGASSAPAIAGVSEANFSGVFQLQNSNPAIVTVTCAPATCAPSAAGGTVDLTFTPLEVGAASVSITDALGTTYTYSYSAVGLNIYTAPVAPGRIDNMTAGPDGNLWGVVESGGSGEIAQIAPATGTPTFYPLPSPFDPTHSPVAVAGPDNAIWLVDEHTPYLYRVSTSGTVGQITTVASADGANPTSIILGADKQTLYYTDSHGNVDTYNVVTKTSAFSINPYDGGTTPTTTLTQDPASGSVYFSDGTDIYKLANGVVSNLASGIGSPEILNMGPDGNLWYTQSGSANPNSYAQAYLCEFTLSEAASYTNPTCSTNNLAWSINTFEFGPDGAAWIVGVDASQNVQIMRSTTSGVQTYFAGASCCPVSNAIATGPDGALWIATTAGVNRVALTQAEAASARRGVSRASVPKARVTPRPRR